MNETHLASLEAALVKGERRVTFADKTIEYRSVEELKEAIREVKKAIDREAAATGFLPGAPRQVRITTAKGT